MKIFISIASYRDSLLATTINSAYDNAKYKDNLVFGIVDQSYDREHVSIDLFPFKSQIRYIRLDPFYARGACWPRHMAQTLWLDEEFYMQVDSHTLFDQDWDEIFINQYNELLQYHEKPIITAYPSGFSIEDNDIKNLTKHTLSGCLALVADEEHSFVGETDMYVGAKCHVVDKTMVHGYLISGNCFFSSSSVIQEVPYDPFLYFSGEEHSYALRLWTNGYNIFHTNNIPVYHLYNRGHRTTVWGDELLEECRPLKWWEYDVESKKRLHQIVTGYDLGIYGVGKVRTLSQYVHFSGIDYLRRTAQERAKNGETVFSLDYKDPIELTN